MPSIMTAYNAVNGVPVSASIFLVDSIARKTYGMKGYVTGDCGAITDIYQGHKYLKDGVESTAAGLIAGVDTDCGGEYQSNAIEALERGLIKESDIDRALINMLTIRMRLGEFDPPSIVPYSRIKPDIINDRAHDALALEVAIKSPVLLKNNTLNNSNKKALPLDPKGIKTIAVLGPQANRVELGDYSGPIEDHYSISHLEGLRNYIDNNNLPIDIIFNEGGNTSRRTDFFTVREFTTLSINGERTKHNATDFDAASPGIISTQRFGSQTLQGIKDGDWILYNDIDITNIDSILLNVSVTQSGGTLEIRAGASTGNIVASQIINTTGTERFGRGATISTKVNTLGFTGPQNLYFCL